MIHRSLLLLCTLLACTLCWCQLNVYKTYQDYVDHNARSYPDVEFKKWKGDEHTVLVFERKGKDDLEVACDGIWGFGYKEVLFRVSKDSKYFVKKSGVEVGAPFVVMLLDDVVYYENGLGVLDAMKRERGQVLLRGMCAALS